MYGEYVLLIRGCVIGESVGGHPYVAKNPKTNYSDALESTSAEALRRIAGKRLSCGSQVWDPEYARTWQAKFAYQDRGKWAKRPAASPRPGPHPAERDQEASAPPSPVKAPANPPSAPPQATPAYKLKMIKLLEPVGAVALEWAVKVGWLLPTESLDDIPLDRVPRSKPEMDALIAAVSAFADGGEPQEPGKPPIEVPRDAHLDHNSPDAPWRYYPMPWGKMSGTKLADMEKKYLFGLWANFVVEEQFNGKPKRPETIEKDKLFRSMLDEAGKHYEFTKKD
jgi:hypothetical protein